MTIAKTCKIYRSLPEAEQLALEGGVGLLSFEKNIKSCRAAFTLVLCSREKAGKLADHYSWTINEYGDSTKTFPEIVSLYVPLPACSVLTQMNIFYAQ
ncbi:MAG: hypothetical protein WCT49_06390 [Candidatus Paceibacterota bacterium]|jgi:hypothetical protein